MSFFRKLLGRWPETYGDFYNRADQHFSNKEYEKAIDDFSEAIRRAEDEMYSSFCHYWRGLSYFEMKQYDRAIADFDESIRLLEKNGNAFAGRGKSYLELGNHEQAIADLTEAIRIGDDIDGEIYLGRAKAYRALGDDASASKDEAMARELSE